MCHGDTLHPEWEKDMLIVLFPLKIIATIILFVLKVTLNAAAFIVFAFSLPFVYLSEILGGFLAILAAVGVGAMLLCWRFGDLDGKTVLIVTFSLGLLSALLMAAEEITEFIEDKLASVSEFFSDLIEDMWL